MATFERELEDLLNQHCLENESNTPDFILARYMRECYDAFVRATNRRERWYDRPLHPTFGAPTGGTQE